MKVEEHVTIRKILEFQKIINDYYREHGRSYPWRQTDDPYKILISEIMLQQTQIERVQKKYPIFIHTFPDFKTLAAASLRKILMIWQGMGYNRRALSLQKIAKRITSEFNGQVPSSESVLHTFPGIGKTTASAIAAFAFQRPTIFIETNIRRTYIHFFFSKQKNVKDSDILLIVKKTFDATNPRIWYYALMDYGSILRKNHPNPNRNSAHYRIQPPFKGSDRQIRGMILKMLLAKQVLTLSRLILKTNQNPARMRRILSRLLKEGFIRKHNNGFSLVDK